jgi:hypothetical protein
VPPLFTPFVHTIEMWAAFVCAGTFYKFIGASAAVKMTAPLPTVEVSEFPKLLVA